MTRIPKTYLRKFLKEALREDLDRRGDITSDSVFTYNHSVKAKMVAKETGVVCGTQMARELARITSSKLKVKVKISDGKRIRRGQTVLEMKGPVKTILKIERLSLNLMGRLSGVATLTAAYVSKVRKYRVQVLDTRKTTPNLRLLEKYAVVCGGGKNRRIGLFDAVLIKDNHIWAWKKTVGRGTRDVGRKSKKKEKREKNRHFVAADRRAARLSELILSVRKKVGKKIKVEIEVDNLKQLKEVLPGKPDLVLLDNMSSTKLRQAVSITRDFCRRHRIRRPLLEASGGINLKTVRKIAATGIDCFSVGALTHSPKNFDYSLELDM